MTRAEYALSEFQKGYNCAQSVLFAFLDEMGVTREAATNMAGGLGGGLRMGEACGAVSGAVMVIGARHGFTIETKWELYKIVTEFMDRFRAENGAIVCRELLGYDFSNPEEQVQAVQSGRTKEVCPGLVACAVKILEELIPSL